MHIPDGFISPQTYLPAAALSFLAWGWAARGLDSRLDETTIPRLAMLTALCYALGLLMLPLPGGTSGHLIGAAMLALIFGVRLAFLAFSLVLLMQALLFGAGGITAMPINALAMGLAGGASAVAIRALTRPLGETASILLATWLSVMISATLVAITLGAQPLIAHKDDGTPLFFPFDSTITLPAILIPHMLLGLAEAALTLGLWRYAKTRSWLQT